MVSNNRQKILTLAVISKLFALLHQCSGTLCDLDRAAERVQGNFSLPISESPYDASIYRRALHRGFDFQRKCRFYLTAVGRQSCREAFDIRLDSHRNSTRQRLEPIVPARMHWTGELNIPAACRGIDISANSDHHYRSARAAHL